MHWEPEEFADAMHKKKKPLALDQDAGPTVSSRESLGDTGETAKRRTKRSRRDRASGASRADRQRLDTSVRSDERAVSEMLIASDSCSSSASGDSGDDDERHVIRKIGDRTFLMDAAAEHESEAAKWRRRRQIIESDDDDSSSGAESSEPRDLQSTRHQQESEPAPLDRHVSTLALPSESRTSSQHKPARVRSSKKRRRYVGGYLHSGDDVDATFIQPEDNANALPDDVARELAFKLGKTKAELRSQLATIAQTLTTNLRAFDAERASVKQLTKRAPTLTLEKLTALHQQVR